MENSTTKATSILLNANISKSLTATLLFWNHQYADKFLPMLLSILTFTILGILGNIIVVSVYILRPPLRTNGRYFIPYLAILDILSTVFSAGLGLLKCYRYVTFPGDTVCKVLTYLTYTSIFASLFLLLFIAIQRYVKVCRPFGRQFSMMECRVLLILSFALPCCLFAPLFLLTGTFHVTNDKLGVTGTRCGFNPEYLAKSSAYRKICAMIPILEICIISSIYYKIWKHMPKQELTGKKDNSDANPNAERETKMAKTTESKSEINTIDELDYIEDHRMSIEKSRVNPQRLLDNDCNGEASLFNRQNCKSKIDSENERLEIREEREDETLGDIQLEKSGQSEDEKGLQLVKSHEDTNIHRKVSGCTCHSRRGHFSRTTTIFIVISILGFVSYMPSAILISIETDDYLFFDKLSPQMFIFCSLFRVFYLFNHSANPIIYGIFDTKFRHELRHLIFR